ncbi:MAG: proton-conducting transporter membrane subunit [Gemmatimonadota bacterium]
MSFLAALPEVLPVGATVLLVLLLPLFGTVLIGISRSRPNLREGATILTGVVLFALVLSLWPEIMAGERPRLIIGHPLPGIPLILEVEPLGYLFSLVASFLWIVTSLYSIGYMRGHHEKNQTRFYLFFAVAIFATMGVAYSGNLFTLFLFYEVLTLCTYPLVTHHQTEKAKRAGRVYLGILLTTSIGFQLLAIVWTYALAGTLDFRSGGILGDARLSGLGTTILLALFVFGVGKAAVMPVHRWLPAAMVAPTPVSALLHAVAVVKAGVFSILKISVYIFGIDILASTGANQWLIYPAAFTVLAASVVALQILWRQGNLKRLLAYSTISQLSYIVLGALIASSMGIIGGGMHIAMHAFGKITLFFAAGSIYVAANKTEIFQLKGVGRRMPWTMGAFSVASLSMIGLPPTGGFFSKWYLMMGVYQAGYLLVFGVLVLSTLLNAAYFVPIIHMAFFQPEDTSAPVSTKGDEESHADVIRDHGEAPWPMVTALIVTAAGTILLFFFSGSLLSLLEPLGGGR